MLGRHDVGHRVVVRRIAGERDNRPILSDVLGELVDLSEYELTIRTAAGPVVVARADIRHAKRIPDQRRLTATESLERIAATGWPAPEQDQLGDWLLRAASGFTNRGNSALAVGDPGRPLPEALDAVREWYAARSLRPAVTVPTPVGGRVTAELTRQLWQATPTVLVQTAQLAELDLTANSDPAVRLDPEPPESWLDVVVGRRGDLPAAARHVLTAVPQVRFAGLYAPDGAALAAGRGVVAADGHWLGLSLIEVTPPLRGQGLGGAVIAALVRWGMAQGAQRGYLQVEERNTAAVSLYARLGFTTHHTYVTWRG